MVSVSEIGIEYYSEVLDTLCRRDLVTKNIDWKMRMELFAVIFGAYKNKLGFVSVQF